MLQHPAAAVRHGMVAAVPGASAPGMMPHQVPHKGTLAPGAKVRVGAYSVIVERYLSEGGYAHVYICRSSMPVNGQTQHVLKRIAVGDAETLKEVGREVDVMKLLRGHTHIVNFIDASAYKLSNGGHEVFILMELCSGGGIIDMMNRRLRDRLTEGEILTIFVCVCEAVARMHALSPPLVHRDLKVENILQAGPDLFKVCDFGSATRANPRPPATMAEIKAVEADLNKHTTLQYRAPEMVDPYQRRVIDEKADVWALGVLLYKLCYYTTPFEEHGPLAILNVQYKIPPFPIYSHKMNTLISSMLKEQSTQRPSVFVVLEQVHRLRGTKTTFRMHVPAAPPSLPSVSPPAAQPPPPALKDDPLISYKAANGAAAMYSSPPFDTAANITPQRRGRPVRAPAPAPAPAPVPVAPATASRHAAPAQDAWGVGERGTKSPAAVAKGGFDGFGDSFGSSPSKKVGAFDDAFGVSVTAAGRLSRAAEAFGDSFASPSSSSRPVLSPSPKPVSSPLARSAAASPRSAEEDEVASRFPSLDEFASSFPEVPTTQSSKPPTPLPSRPHSSSARPPPRHNFTGSNVGAAGVTAPSKDVGDGARSAHVTGYMMKVDRPRASSPKTAPNPSPPVAGGRFHLTGDREPSSTRSPSSASTADKASYRRTMQFPSSPSELPVELAAQRLGLNRTGGSKPVTPQPPRDLLTGDDDVPPQSRASPAQPPRDLLTGDSPTMEMDSRAPPSVSARADKFGGTNSAAADDVRRKRLTMPSASPSFTPAALSPSSPTSAALTAALLDVSSVSPAYQSPYRRPQASGTNGRQLTGGLPSSRPGSGLGRTDPPPAQEREQSDSSGDEEGPEEAGAGTYARSVSRPASRPQSSAAGEAAQSPRPPSHVEKLIHYDSPPPSAGPRETTYTSDKLIDVPSPQTSTFADVPPTPRSPQKPSPNLVERASFLQDLNDTATSSPALPERPSSRRSAILDHVTTPSPSMQSKSLVTPKLTDSDIVSPRPTRHSTFSPPPASATSASPVEAPPFVKGHRARKSSITDVVSKYESLTHDAQAAAAVTRRPPVAAKPVGLRTGAPGSPSRSSLDSQHSSRPLAASPPSRTSMPPPPHKLSAAGAGFADRFPDVDQPRKPQDRFAADDTQIRSPKSSSAIANSAAMPPPISTTPLAAQRRSPTPPPASSASESPEKPFPGVAARISQWNSGAVSSGPGSAGLKRSSTLGARRGGRF